MNDAEYARFLRGSADFLDGEARSGGKVLTVTAGLVEEIASAQREAASRLERREVAAPLRIYVAGPYTSDVREIRDRNVAVADGVGRALARLGHIPFVPHTMSLNWENDPVLRYDDFLRIDLSWLRVCDALYYIASSKGADKELEVARSLGLSIYRSLDEVSPITR